MLEERRRIARDVHDFVGHGLAAMMLQVTSARHVLRRDPAAAEEALRVGRGRRPAQHAASCAGPCVAAQRLRAGRAAAASRGDEIPALVERGARRAASTSSSGCAASWPGSRPGVGLALYRIAQEALANAARHAPRARTVLAIELADGQVVARGETRPDRWRRRLPASRRAARATA